MQKKTKMEKKGKQIFSNCKNVYAKKKSKILFQKNRQKKGRNAKKGTCGVSCTLSNNCSFGRAIRSTLFVEFYNDFQCNLNIFFVINFNQMKA